MVCPSQCAQCKHNQLLDTPQCTSCPEGSTLVLGVCIEINPCLLPGQYFNKQLKKCGFCRIAFPGCSSCGYNDDEVLVCSNCDEPYELDVTGNCVPDCDEGCKACTFREGVEVCTECDSVNGFVYDAKTKTCIENDCEDN